MIWLALGGVVWLWLALVERSNQAAERHTVEHEADMARFKAKHEAVRLNNEAARAKRLAAEPKEEADNGDSATWKLK